MGPHYAESITPATSDKTFNDQWRFKCFLCSHSLSHPHLKNWKNARRQDGVHVEPRHMLRLVSMILEYFILFCLDVYSCCAHMMSDLTDLYTNQTELKWTMLLYLHSLVLFISDVYTNLSVFTHVWLTVMVIIFVYRMAVCFLCSHHLIIYQYYHLCLSYILCLRTNSSTRVTVWLAPSPRHAYNFSLKPDFISSHLFSKLHRIQKQACKSGHHLSVTKPNYVHTLEVGFD